MIFSIILYNFILLGSTFFLWFSEKCKYPYSTIFFYIAFLIVFLPSALRYEIGVDFFSYKMLFQYISNGVDFDQIGVEIGYYYLNLAVSKLGLGFEWVIAIVAFLIFYLFFKSFPYKNRFLYGFIFVSLFFFSANNLLRNWISLGIIWLSIFSYISNKNIMKLILGIFFASIFHKSALIFLFLPFVLFFKFTPNLKFFSYIGVLFVFVAFVFGGTIAQFILNSSIFDFLGYSSYAVSAWNRETDLGSGLGMLIKILFLIYPIFYLNKWNLDKKVSFLFSLFIIMLIFSIVLSSYVHIFNRLPYLFSIGYAFALYLYLNVKSIMYRKTIVFGFIFVCLLMFNIFILNGSTSYLETCGGARIVPYVTILNKEDSTRDPDLTHMAHRCEAFFGS